jgi:hypothetical protein
MRQKLRRPAGAPPGDRTSALPDPDDHPAAPGASTYRRPMLLAGAAAQARRGAPAGPARQAHVPIVLLILTPQTDQTVGSDTTVSGPCPAHPNGAATPRKRRQTIPETDH